MVGCLCSSLCALYCIGLRTARRHRHHQLADSLCRASLNTTQVNLAQVVLQLMAMGIHEPQRFDYLSPPSPQALTRALSTLYALGCIEVPSFAHTQDQANDSKGSSTGTAPFVTEHGRKVAALPLDPMYAHFVLKAGEMGCVAEALTAVAMLSAENVLFMPSQHGGAEAAARRAKAITAHKALSDYEGDVPTLINVYERWRRAPGKDARAKRGWCWDNFVNARSVERAHDVRTQLGGLVQRLGVDPMVSCGAGTYVERRRREDRREEEGAVMASYSLTVTPSNARRRTHACICMHRAANSVPLPCRRPLPQHRAAHPLLAVLFGAGLLQKRAHGEGSGNPPV